ncbi:MAG: tRNA 2-thiouridine(34) synthase MnmA [Candidatus Terrybacteria bacterium CG10_big_fil_rev_8_21_14_0_10_41_10]|uniref:tRNA-specific 2-thiouridylase MnmA n=1 Tax=Candidatus Terrybacteria bacterium CG10_big_fil_rev_8_21_14_0_10_41_10 TaxID=1975026 RepID=A0A2M8LA85_9BACT|nr:MAG: tRNA 2-thiouridine(34) synthase MnmA [Candidatus Terrybacteria bacterium CG10_big_fil_rev_8_21_14_0_10_41_10]
MEIESKQPHTSSLRGRRKVFVAMSGGVDSSVAALLLQKSGKYELVGAFIKGWYPSGVACSWRGDRQDAMRVCAKLGIPFITIDAEKEYKKEVVDYMIREYKTGRTPNPDIMCNQKIKFGIFLKKAIELGADFIATGHYVKLSESRGSSVSPARLIRPAAHSPVLAESSRKNGNHADSAAEASETATSSRFTLFIARDSAKDQSYFLWTLTQNQLKYSLFPLGNLLKGEVRKIAKENDLPTASKDESQGVCFIGEFNMEKFLEKHIKPKKGKILTTSGEVIGEHNGIMFYTIGQRHGFGFGGGGGGPYYVVDKDIKKNILIVAEEKEEKKFEKKELAIDNVNWVGGAEPDFSRKYQARARYRQPLQDCRVEKINKLGNDGYKIIFSQTQRAITPGQSLVIYDEEEMIGGGVI